MSELKAMDKIKRIYQDRKSVASARGGTEAASPPNPAYPRRLLSDMSSAERKEYPIITGVLDYFPDALVMVAHVSYKGNEKHNPGQPLHHARGKSADHLDCIGRHLIERDRVEDDVLHMANEVWRSLAELQEMCEKKYNLSLPRGATAPGVELKSNG